MATQAPSTAHWHPRLVQAAIALNENRLDVAERLLKPHLQEDPFDVAAIRMLAELAGRIGRWKDSENLLRRAVELAPRWTAARANLAVVLGRMGRPAEAMELMDGILADEPDWVGHWNLKAATLARLGDFEESIKLYESVLERAPNQPKAWLSYGHMLKTVGRQDDGIAAYRRAITLKPTLGEAWFSLSNLKTFKFNEDDIAAMEGALAGGELDPEDRFHIDFALGKAMHDLGRTEEAFEHYSKANALRLEGQPYEADDTSRKVAARIAEFDADVLGKPGGSEAPDPIFIVGMPRAGSTLVEQILSSHSLVEGTSELADIPALSVFGKSELSAEQRTELGEKYLRRAGVQRRTDRPFFIDKLPNNWLHIPFILKILPNAKIIDARRHPLGCCFSNFRQHFAHGQDFTYDLSDVGRYYADYVRLMAHIDEVLPGRIHRVIYERMVDDTEAEVRALLDYCGLEFEPACLEFYKTERAVRTASSEQVRRPIYRDATEEWKPYEPYLGPLKDALGDVLDAYPDVPATFPQR